MTSNFLSAFLSLRPMLEARMKQQLGSRAAAEDVLHDTWMKLSTLSERNIENQTAYITQAAVNTAIGHLRKEKRRSEIAAEIKEVLWSKADLVTPERETIAKDLIRAVQAELNSLPERTRQIFLRNRIDGISHRRIAEELGISEEAVYYHIRKTLDRLAAIQDPL